jgi:hypothetical protein
MNKVLFLHINFICALSLLFCCNANLHAQQSTIDSTKYVTLLDTSARTKTVFDKGNFPKEAQDVLDGLQITGYYRFVTNLRKLHESYAHIENNRFNVFVGDDAQIPQLMLNIQGTTSDRTSFGTDLFIWSPMMGAGQIENIKGLNLGVSLYGNFSTKLGNFNVRTGGINWFMLSPFTFQANKGYNRYSVYERNPWDPNTAHVASRYEDFYSSGAINQDLRWGNQAFQGLIVEGTQLANRFSFAGMYGKTQVDGGLSAVPNSSYGGKLKKEFNVSDYVSLNTFNNRSFLDSLVNRAEANTAGFNMHSVEYQQQFNKIKLWAELGLGRRFAATNYGKFGEAISVKLNTNVARKYPLELHLYRISPNVLNNNSVFINSSIQQTTLLASNNQAILLPANSAVVPIGQLTNNRQGVELNAQLNFGRFKNSIGYANAAEIEKLSNKLTYGHPFNNFALARFWRWDFPSEVGPYNNLNKLYRSVFETLALTEQNALGMPLFRKYFNTVEINSKYKSKLLDKDLFIFYLGNFNSVQNRFAPMVNFTTNSLLRTYDHQLEMYWRVHPMLVWNNYASFERIIANYNTEVDVVSKRPKNQTGYAFATGCDIQLSKSVGLYVRQRWMKYSDASFANDRYKGWETSIELKAFF